MTAAELEAIAGPEPTPEDLISWSISGPLPSELKVPDPE
jgi:hypothetical protein